jgi:hypothetical protein
MLKQHSIPRQDALQEQSTTERETKRVANISLNQIQTEFCAHLFVSSAYRVTTALSTTGSPNRSVIVPRLAPSTFARDDGFQHPNHAFHPV